ncbi:MAG: hypothetical protein M1268_03185 [Patescibacteria group bacterium]|nr:hypothetical protein [Patescibacteria group bacterium]
MAVKGEIPSGQQDVATKETMGYRVAQDLFSRTLDSMASDNSLMYGEGYTRTVGNLKQKLVNRRITKEALLEILIDNCATLAYKRRGDWDRIWD